MKKEKKQHQKKYFKFIFHQSWFTKPILRNNTKIIKLLPTITFVIDKTQQIVVDTVSYQLIFSFLIFNFLICYCIDYKIQIKKDI